MGEPSACRRCDGNPGDTVRFMVLFPFYGAFPKDWETEKYIHPPHCSAGCFGIVL